MDIKKPWSMPNAKLGGQSKNKIYKLSLLILYVETKVESLLPMNAFLIANSRSPEEDQLNKDALACGKGPDKQGRARLQKRTR